MDQRLQRVRNRKVGIFARCGLGCLERTGPSSGVHVDCVVQEPQRLIRRRGDGIPKRVLHRSLLPTIQARV